jgi:putative peptide zinc metalloprotease protein
MAFKVLGVILFVIEVVWFILRPIYIELKTQWQGRSEILRRPRTLITLGVFLLGISALFAPLSTRVEFPAMAVAAGDAALYPVAAGQIERIERKDGEAVKAGDVILVLRAPELETELRRSQLRLVLLDQRLARIAADQTERSELTVLTGQREAEQAKLENLQAQAAELVVRAPRDGVLRDMDPALRVGLWMGVRNPIGRVIEGPGGEVRGYVEEAELRRLADGATGKFIPDEPMAQSFPVKLASVGRTAIEDVDLLALASTNEGPIPVTEDARHRLKPGISVYPVRLTAEAPAGMNVSQRGRVFVQGAPESFAARATRRIIGVLIRESGA